MGELDTGHAFELWARIYAGDFTQMSLRSTSLMKEAVERGDKNALTTLGVFMVPHTRLVADDAGGAAAAVDEVRRSGGWRATTFSTSPA